MAPASRRLLWWKLAVWVGCLVPLVLLFSRGFGAAGLSLGANPIETVLLTTGITALNILLVSLAVTPVRILSGQNYLARLRRPLGLFSFFYLLLHFLTYLILDLRLDWPMLWTDIAERPYITVGVAALVGMIPLALTSTAAMQRRLGRRWARLHQLVYGIAILAVVHFLWQVKLDIREPLIYAGILALLLGFRIQRGLQLKRKRARAAAESSR